MAEEFQPEAKAQMQDAETPVELTTVSFQLAPGRMIGDRYEVKSVIGQGGMGCVYLVEQLFLHKVYALKTLNPGGHMSDLAWRRFQKEAQATSAFDHPNLIKVYDFGMIDDAQPFFVMDYFEGETLADLIEKQGGLPLSDVLNIFSQVCMALEHAHMQGVIHRDLKPSNIMVAKQQDGFRVKVVDFGIAKLINADHETLALTQTGEVFGTPYYMSPEQCLGIAIDNRADIYSLGCVLFQAFTGNPPFIGDTALSIMMQHQTATPVSLKEGSLGKTFPDAAERVVRKMLQKKPDDRYQDLLEVAKDLELVKLGQRVISQKNPVLARASSKPLTLILGLCTVAVVLSLLALAFIVGRSSVVVKDVPSVAGNGDNSDRLMTKDWDRNRLQTKVPIGAPPSPKKTTVSKQASANSEFYSVLGDPVNPYTAKLRTFHFGEKPLGVMVLPAGVDCLSAEVMKDGTKKVFATGDVVINNFKPLTLMINDDVAENPRLLKGFREDEVAGLKLISIDNAIFTNELMASFTPMAKSLTSLKVEGSDSITDECIPALDRLPNLVELYLNKTGVHGASVGKMKNIKKFRVLDLGSLHNDTASGVLPALAGSAALEELNLRRGNLDDANTRLLETLPNLRKLNLSSNGLGDVTIRRLQNLKHLEELNVYACKEITAKSFPVLAKLPSLKALTIGLAMDPAVNQSEFAALAKMMPPKCTIKYSLND